MGLMSHAKHVKENQPPRDTTQENRGSRTIEKLADGNYNILADTMDYFSNCTGKDGALHPTTFGKMRLAIGFSFKDTNGLEVSFIIPMNVLPYLVQAFTGNAVDLPPVPAGDKPEEISKYLLLVLETIKNSGKTVTVPVEGGYAKWKKISGCVIPSKYYHFIFKGVFNRKGGLPEPEKSRPHPEDTSGIVRYQYTGLFTIRYNTIGKACGWSGVQFMVGFLPYPLEKGLDEKGNPSAVFKSYSDGRGLIPSAEDTMHFWDLATPSLESAMAKNMANPMGELPNVLPSLNVAAALDNVLLGGRIGITKGGNYNTLHIGELSLSDVSYTTKEIPTAPPPTPPPAPPKVTPLAQTPAHTKVLLEVLGLVATTLHGDNNAATRIAVMKKYLEKLIVLGDIPQSKRGAPPSSFSVDDIRKILQNMNEDSALVGILTELKQYYDALYLMLTKDEIPF